MGKQILTQHQSCILSDYLLNVNQLVWIYIVFNRGPKPTGSLTFQGLFGSLRISLSFVSAFYFYLRRLFIKRFQLLVGDVCIVQTELFQVYKSFDVFQSGVGEARAGKIQRFELG
jgi:hypothetical protein